MGEGLGTAQDSYRAMMRSRIAPALRRMGFKGSGGRFRYTEGPYEAHVDAQKSRWNSKDRVEFTFNLSVRHTPSPPPNAIWGERLGHLTQDRSDVWWTFNLRTSPDDVADAVISALENCGLPAIQAAIQGSELPSVPALPVDDEPVISPKEFWESHERLFALGHRIQACNNDELFELLNDEFSRGAALDMIGRRAMSDYRALPAMSGALTSDPDVHIRRSACMILAHVAGHPELDRLLLDATDEDDRELRWTARYALLVRGGSKVATAP